MISVFLLWSSSFLAFIILLNSWECDTLGFHHTAGVDWVGKGKSSGVGNSLERQYSSLCVWRWLLETFCLMNLHKCGVFTPLFSKCAPLFLVELTSIWFIQLSQPHKRQLAAFPRDLFYSDLLLWGKTVYAGSREVCKQSLRKIILGHPILPFSALLKNPHSTMGQLAFRVFFCFFVCYKVVFFCFLESNMIVLEFFSWRIAINFEELCELFRTFK